MDIFDNDEDNSIGGLLDMFEQQAEEKQSEGTIVTYRNMALPKQWSGKIPKVLLAELVTRLDRYAVISYSMESGHGRAKRAAVSIRWDGKTTDRWAMSDVACGDQMQAENYVATVALHALTYPPLEGFAGTSTASTSNITFFRRLPAAFRDLWDELEVARKRVNDSVNRTIWSKLRQILEIKAPAIEKAWIRAYSILTDAYMHL
jgi:ATP-dependent RNA helicase DHX29